MTSYRMSLFYLIELPETVTTGKYRGMLTEKQMKQCYPGIERLRHPVLPLVRLVGMLYLTGPFETISSLLNELNETVKTAGLSYEEPGEILRNYQEDMLPFERLKHPQPGSRIILDEELSGVDSFTAVDSWVAQNILTRELEAINSLLCEPCGCSLCCIGPSKNLSQDFFEIPLQDREIQFFSLHQEDSNQSRSSTSNDAKPLQIKGAPFYSHKKALVHWKSGWSLILPRDSHCPHLDIHKGGCRIYPDRPEVCRRPQIFPYMLEREPGADQIIEGKKLPAFITRKKLLAIWDCPYVKQFQDEIGRYAVICELEPVFKENKM